MSDYLPQDVLLDILTRLSVKSLVRCTSVCKSWLSLITNPRFITSHLNQSAKRRTEDLMLVSIFSKESREDLYSLHYDNETFSDYSKLPIRVKFGYRIIGVFDGVICLSRDAFSYMEEFFLWNPSIEKLVELPPDRVTFNSHGPYMHAVGCGIEPLTNDYKIVRVVYLDCEIIPAEVDVYTLSTGTWRNISTHVGLSNFIMERAPQAYLNGILHWVGYYGRRERNLIVSFHMGNEVFGELELPSSFVKKWVWQNHIRTVVYQDSLALIENDRSEDFSIWVMKEYGVKESWTKLFTVDYKGVFIGFRKNGDFVIRSDGEYLVSYDPNAKTIQNLGIHGTDKAWHGNSSYAGPYTESLALFGVKCREAVMFSKQASGKGRRGLKLRSKRAKKRRERAKKKKKTRVVDGVGNQKHGN